MIKNYNVLIIDTDDYAYDYSYIITCEEDKKDIINEMFEKTKRRRRYYEDEIDNQSILQEMMDKNIILNFIELNYDLTLEN